MKSQTRYLSFQWYILAPLIIDTSLISFSSFAIKGLIPHVEKQLRTLHEIVTNRKGRSLFNVGVKRWFGQSRPGAARYGQSWIWFFLSLCIDFPERYVTNLAVPSFVQNRDEDAFFANSNLVLLVPLNPELYIFHKVHIKISSLRWSEKKVQIKVHAWSFILLS